MTESFSEFEQSGWSNPSVASYYHDHLSVVTTQSVEALLDAAGVVSGSKVLDVATGAGYAAAAAHRHGAVVTGVDFSDEQVRLARRENPELTFMQGDASSLQFEDGSFDAVVCGFGVCHLRDPSAFFAQAFRVLRPGGRLGFTVWELPTEARMFGAIFGAVRAHGSMDVGLPVGPDFFLFSNPDNGRHALSEVGFVDCQAETVAQMWKVASADDALDTFIRGSVRTAAVLNAQSESSLKAIREQVRRDLNIFKTTEGMTIPMPAVLSSGRKP